MAPPTDSHKYWKRLRALGLVLDLAALIIIIIAGNRVHQGFYGLIGIGLYFSIVINLMGLFPNIPDEELYRWNPVFGGNLRHVLRIGFELLGVLLIVAGAVLYATLQSVKTVPLASIGAVVGFSLVAAYHLGMIGIDIIFTNQDLKKPKKRQAMPVSGRMRY